MDRGDAISVSVHLDRPEDLPPNARIEVLFDGPSLGAELERPRPSDPAVRSTADWGKSLHALDPDLYLIYRAPVSGDYGLRVEVVRDREQPLGALPHDTGLAPMSTPLPTLTPAVSGVPLTIDVRHVGALGSGPVVLEAEPNNAPEQATPLPLDQADDSGTVYVVGGSDDLEYYNNTRTGHNLDDWY